MISSPIAFRPGSDPKSILGTLLTRIAQVLAPRPGCRLTFRLGARCKGKPNAPHSFWSRKWLIGRQRNQGRVRRVLRLKAGTKLYSVVAIDEKPGNPNAAKADGGVLIGSLVLESTLKASKWEDERLFFQHARP